MNYKKANSQTTNLAISLGFTDNAEPTLIDIQHWLRYFFLHVEITYMKRLEVYWVFCLGHGMVSEQPEKGAVKTKQFQLYDDGLETGIEIQLDRLSRNRGYVVGRKTLNNLTQYLRNPDNTADMVFDTLLNAFQYLREVKQINMTNQEMLDTFKFEPLL